MRASRRNIPQINSSSSADIAFLLLIFFLITSSLDSEKGMYRRLSPIIPEEVLRKKMNINERNLLPFSVNENNQIFCKGDSIRLSDLKAVAKVFIANPENKDYLPEKQLIDIPLFGFIPVTNKHMIVLDVNRETDYQTYLFLQNELMAAYHELRDELSQKQFNTSIDRLTDEQQAAIRNVYPQHISETESGSERREERYE